jgi:hypothetical protein
MGDPAISFVTFNNIIHNEKRLEIAEFSMRTAVSGGGSACGDGLGGLTKEVLMMKAQRHARSSLVSGRDQTD